MDYTYSNYCAGIQLTDEESVHTHELDDHVIAFTLADGTLAEVEVLDTRPFGDPFDDAAAERAVAWVRERLQLGAAS